jgi:hypothetical protein
MHAEFEWFETRLTVARWHLDAALSASVEMAAVHLRQSREIQGRLRARLSECTLAGEQRSRIAAGLDELHARLLAVFRPA